MSSPILVNNTTNLVSSKELTDFMQSFSNRVAIYHKRDPKSKKKKKKMTKVEKQLARLTMSQLVEFVNMCKEKYMKGNLTGPPHS